MAGEAVGARKAELPDVDSFARRRNYPVAILALGETYADLGQFDKAIEYHERLKKNYYWSFALAATLGAAGRIDAALEMAQKYEKNGDALVLVLNYAAIGG